MKRDHGVAGEQSRFGSWRFGRRNELLIGAINEALFFLLLGSQAEVASGSGLALIEMEEQCKVGCLAIFGAGAMPKTCDSAMLPDEARNRRSCDDAAVLFRRRCAAAVHFRDPTSGHRQDPTLPFPHCSYANQVGIECHGDHNSQCWS